MNTQRCWALAAAVLTCIAPVRMNAQQTDSGAVDDELRVGQATFNELKARGEIIESSPLLDSLMPIIEPILRAAQPRYNHPFKVFMVHEAQPNAFATPGGYVYVVDAMMYFAKNREELAGTLCHEVSHTLHHDSMKLMDKEKRLRWREVGGAILIGPTRAHILAIALLGKLHSLLYSREAEARADQTGGEICAQAGSNPWGLVWLFQEFKGSRQVEIPQMLSDHPADQNRINALTRQFTADSATYGRFSKDPASATPLTIPPKAPVVFLR